MQGTMFADTHVDVALRVNGNPRRLRLDSRVTLLDAADESDRCRSPSNSCCKQPIGTEV
jgi:hypothetical protein